MNGQNDRDDRLRKLFSRLGRVRAPEGFEERVARAVERRRSSRSALSARLRAIAVPGAALLLVGVISLVVFRSAPDEPAGPPVPSVDSATAGAGGTTPSFPAAGSEPSSTAPTPASTADQHAGKGDTRATPPVAAPPTIGRQQAGRSVPSAAPAPLPPARMAKGARPSAGQRSLMEVVPGDSAILPDSAAPADTAAATDSLRGRDTSGAGTPVPGDTLGLPADTTAGRSIWR